MATLTSSDLLWCADWLRRDPAHRITLKQSGLSKSQLSAILQTIETYLVDSYSTRPGSSLRTAINTAAGATPTLEQNMALWYVWSAWKGRS